MVWDGRERRSYPLATRHCTIGRDPGCALRIASEWVSGLHARIHGEHGRVFLTDVGSSNGTFVRVNGKHAVRSGDLILMGQQLFRAEY